MLPPSLLEPELDEDDVVAEDDPLPLADGFLGPFPLSGPLPVCSDRTEFSPPVAQWTEEQGVDRKMDVLDTFKAAVIFAAN